MLPDLTEKGSRRKTWIKELTKLTKKTKKTKQKPVFLLRMVHLAVTSRVLFQFESRWVLN